MPIPFSVDAYREPPDDYSDIVERIRSSLAWRFEMDESEVHRNTLLESLDLCDLAQRLSLIEFIDRELQLYQWNENDVGALDTVGDLYDYFMALQIFKDHEGGDLAPLPSSCVRTLMSSPVPRVRQRALTILPEIEVARRSGRKR